MAHSTIDGLLSLGEKSRHLKDIAHKDPTLREINLIEMIDRITETVSQEYPGVSFEIDAPEKASLVTYPTVETGFTELIENIAAHGGESPTGTICFVGSRDAA